MAKNDGGRFQRMDARRDACVAKALDKCFRYIIKQMGGMLAKGRLLGVQFEEIL